MDIEYKKIKQRQGSRVELNSIIRDSLLAFDTDNNHLLYSKDGASYFDFYNSNEIDNKFDNIDASRITTGIFDIARIPVLPSQKQITSIGLLTDLTPAQMIEIGQGTVVTTTDGFRWVYSGNGAKTVEASYTKLADITPDWTVISNRPTTLSAYNVLSNDTLFDNKYAPFSHNQAWSTITSVPVASTSTSGVLTSTDWNTFNGKISLSSVLTGYVVGSNAILSATDTVIGAFGKIQLQINNRLTSSSALNPANVTQTSSYRFVTDTEKANWNGKQNAITLGTTAQYFRGDLSLATFPTNLSSFTNGPGYITSAIGDLRYAPFSHNQAWSTITSVPVASTSTSGVLTSTDWNTFNNKASTAQLSNYLPLSGGTLTGNLFGTTATFGNASLASYTPNGNFAWFGKTGENPAVGTNLAGMITGDGETYIGARAGKMVRLDVAGVDVVTIGGSLVSVYQPTLFSSSVTLANNTWNAIGDDSQFGDMNVGNTVGFRGVQNTNIGYIRFGTTSVASTGTLLNDFGWDGSKFTIGTNTVWHSGNLTNLNQLSNGPGYLTTSTGKAQFSLPPTTSVITWFKIGTIGTVAALGSGQANLMLDSYANYNYGNNQAPWESIRFASRGSIFLEVRSMLGVGVNTYGYTTNGAVLELWVRTNSMFTPNIMYHVNSSQGVGVSYGLLFQTGTEPSGITYVTTKTIYDDRYLQLTGGTLTGALNAAEGFTNKFSRDVTPTSAANAIYSIAPIYVTRQANSGVEQSAGIGFVNYNVNGAFFYLDAASGVFKYCRDIATPIRTIWDSSNLTNLNQLSNGPGYVTSAIGDLRYQPLENQRLSTTNEVVFSGLRLGYYPATPAYSGIWASGLTKGDDNWSYLCQNDNNKTFLNAASNIELHTTSVGIRAPRVTIGHTLTSFLTPISGSTATFSGILKASQSGLFQVQDYLGNSANDWVWFGYTGIHINASRYAGFMASKDGSVIASARYNSKGFLNAENNLNTSDNVCDWNIDRFHVYKNMTVIGTISAANQITTKTVFIANQTQSGDDAGSGSRIALIDSASNAKGWIIQHGSTNDKLQFFHQDTVGGWVEKAFITSTGSLNAATISEGGTLLSNKYGLLAGNNTWTGIYNTFNEVVVDTITSNSGDLDFKATTTFAYNFKHGSQSSFNIGSSAISTPCPISAPYFVHASSSIGSPTNYNTVRQNTGATILGQYSINRMSWDATYFQCFRLPFASDYKGYTFVILMIYYNPMYKSPAIYTTNSDVLYSVDGTSIATSSSHKGVGENMRIVSDGSSWYVV